MRRRLWCLALLLPAALPAQATITGVVRDTARRPIVDAEVMVLSHEKRVRTDSTGAFRISGLDAGTYEVRARRLGYYAANWTVVLRAKTMKPIIFELQARPQMLDTVTVSSTCARFEVGGFLCRQKKGSGGVLLDVDQIDSANPRFPADIFRNIPGWRVEASRGGLRPVPLAGWRCMTILVNGMAPTRANPVPQWPNEMLGIEVYTKPDSIPPEYAHYTWGTIGAGRQTVSARCSLVVYWTTVRPNR